MGFAVSTVNIKLVMESVTRKGRGLVIEPKRSMAILRLWRGKNGEKIRSKNL